MRELQNLSDDDLLRLMTKGDEPAFSVLYERRQGAVFSFALHMSGSATVAEEVNQEVFLHLIREPQRYDPRRGSLAAYLFGVARNFTRRCQERDRAYVPIAEDTGDGADLVLSHDDMLSDLARTEAIERLRQAILCLPEAYREVIVMCDLQEMEYAAAAATLGCTLGTLSSRLHRARALLLQKMKAVTSVRK